MNDQISNLARNSSRWKFQAGTTEIALGVILLSAGLALLLPRTPTFYLSLFMLGIMTSGLLIEYLQRRYIFPRIGYVEYRIRPRKGIWRLILVFASSLIGIWGILFLAHFVPMGILSQSWFSSAVAILVGIFLFLYVVLVKQRRFLILGLISIVMGFLLSPFGLHELFTGDIFGIDKLGFYFLVMGATSLISGGLAFRTFLNHTSLIERQTDEQ